MVSVYKQLLPFVILQTYSNMTLNVIIVVNPNNVTRRQ